MEKLLLFVKHRMSFFWNVIEWTNGTLFNALFASRVNKICAIVLEESLKPPYSFRKLKATDSLALFDLINAQQPCDLEFFKPHGFDLKSIEKQLRKPDFLMMGAFNGDRIVGYFFLRFFINRKCFVGRLIDKEYRGKGIEDTMNRIMYETVL